MNRKNWIRFLGSLVVGGLLVACATAPDVELVSAVSLNRYKAVLTAPSKMVPSTKTPDAALAGNGDLGITLGGTSDSLCFYIGKNDFWRAYPVYPGGIAFRAD